MPVDWGWSDWRPPTGLDLPGEDLRGPQWPAPGTQASQEIGEKGDTVGAVCPTPNYAKKNPGEKDKSGAQDKRLSDQEIRKLKQRGIDPERLKGGKDTGHVDLYKDRQGNILVKPKGGSGPGEPTDYNIKQL